MSEITRQSLEANLASCQAQLEQALAQANQLQGAINVISALIAQLDAPAPVEAEQPPQLKVANRQ